MSQDTTITFRLPETIKARLSRSGKISKVIRQAIDRWIAVEDKAVRRARETLQVGLSAREYQNIVNRIRVTGPTMQPVDAWCRDAGISVADDKIANAIETLIRFG